jgi:hypothetical protein
MSGLVDLLALVAELRTAWRLFLALGVTAFLVYVVHRQIGSESYAALAIGLTAILGLAVCAQWQWGAKTR